MYSSSFPLLDKIILYTSLIPHSAIPTISNNNLIEQWGQWSEVKIRRGKDKANVPHPQKQYKVKAQALKHNHDAITRLKRHIIWHPLIQFMRTCIAKPLTYIMLQQAFASALSISSHHIRSSINTIFSNFRLIAFLELGYVLLINGSVGLAHSRAAAPKHFSWRRTKTRSILLMHIGAGMSEVLRWHIRALYQDSPMADGLDVVLCLTQSFTNLALVKWMHRSYPIMTRPSYQAGAFLRPALTLLAWTCCRPDLHRASIKTLNVFGYARLLIHFLGPIIKTKHHDTASEKQKYNIAIFGSAILAIAESRIQYAVPAYAGIVILIARMNRWSTAELASKEKKPMWKRMLLFGCASAGFMELEWLKSLPKVEQYAEHHDEVDVYGDHHGEEYAKTK